MIIINSHTEIPKIQKAIENIKTISLDVETDGLDPILCKWRLLQLKIGDSIFIIPIEEIGIKYATYIVGLISNVPEIIGHNIKFDLKVIYANTGIELQNLFDTMLAEIILTLGYMNIGYSLADLVKRYCDVELDKDTRMDFVNSPIITEEMLVYSALDVKYLEEIANIQKKKLEESNQTFVAKLENATTKAVAEMELTGVPLDKETWITLADLTQKECDELEIELNKVIIKTLSGVKVKNALELYELLAIPVKTKKKTNYLTEIAFTDIIMDDIIKEFNINSTKQLQYFLRLRGIEVTSTGEKVLRKVSKGDEFIEVLLQYKEKFKRLTSFGYNILKLVNPITDRLHPTLNQLGARTGRFSCSKPNLQQAIADPRYRNNHKAGDGYLFVVSDYSQQELRIQACVTGEQRMIDAFYNNEDPHAVTASVIYGVPLEEVTKHQRSKAKTLNFALSYGSSEYGLTLNFGFTDDEASELYSAYWEGHPNIKKKMEEVSAFAVKNGYSVTLTGRRRYYPTKKLMTTQEINSYRGKIERASFNHLIQGSGADMTKLAMSLIHKHNPFGDKLKLILVVHDEIVCQVSEEIAEEAKDFVEAQMLKASDHIIKGFPMVVDPKVSKYWEH